MLYFFKIATGVIAGSGSCKLLFINPNVKKKCLASCITVSIFSNILGGHVDWCGDFIFTCANGGVNIVQVSQKTPCFFSLNQCCESGLDSYSATLWIRIPIPIPNTN